ncbi:MAG: LysM peptidoglycan-binding domain-containing protein [Thermoflexales bacterium]|nr:LysM peptidoglycan-binding domain-containing protein [Thermoflexales bacterium]
MPPYQRTPAQPARRPKGRSRLPYAFALGLVVVGLVIGALSLRALSAPSPTPEATATLRRPSVSSDTDAPPTEVPTSAPTARPTATQTPAPTLPPQGSHTVQAGETLLGIALKYDVSMARIQIANDLGDNQTVRVGQTLIIPASISGESAYWRARVVRAGDTLSSLAAEAGVSVAELDRVNALQGSSVIRLGSTLILPINVPQPAPTSPPVTRAATVLPPTVPPATRTPLPTVAPTVAPSPAPTRTPAAVDGSVAAQEAQVLAAYNEARAAAGVPPLTLSPALSAAARAHAQDCAARGYGSHVGSDGSDTKTRILRAGYLSPLAWGENWAWAHTTAEAWQMWFIEEAPSGPHRDNILSARYREVGIGVVASNGGYYYITDFGAR